MPQYALTPSHLLSTAEFHGIYHDNILINPYDLTQTRTLIVHVDKLNKKTYKSINEAKTYFNCLPKNSVGRTYNSHFQRLILQISPNITI